MSFNHYHQTAQSRNPLTMAGFDEKPSVRPKTPELRPRSAQATSDLLSWSKPINEASRSSPQQARRQNRDKITQSSHNLLAHQEFQAKTPQNKIKSNNNNLSKSTSSIIAPEPQFLNLTGTEKRAKSPVKTSNYRSMKNGAESRRVTNWGNDDVNYQSKYNKLEDNSVSQKNKEQYKRRNILHLTENSNNSKDTTKISTRTCSNSYRKNFATSKGLIGGVGEGADSVATQNVKTMHELNNSFEKLSTRRENELNSSPLCRKEVNKPKWR
jgi:hypothetical protein